MRILILSLNWDLQLCRRFLTSLYIAWVNNERINETAHLRRFAQTLTVGMFVKVRILHVAAQLFVFYVQRFWVGLIKQDVLIIPSCRTDSTKQIWTESRLWRQNALLFTWKWNQVINECVKELSLKLDNQFLYCSHKRAWKQDLSSNRENIKEKKIFWILSRIKRLCKIPNDSLIK